MRGLSLSRFTPELWDQLNKAKNTDRFWPEFNQLQSRLEASLILFMAQPEEQRAPEELAQLWSSVKRWVELEMSFDTLARGESYTLPNAPFTPAIQRFMSYARTQSSSYREGLMSRYWSYHQTEQ